MRKSKKHPGASPEIISKEIVGTVGTIYKFNALCDYQYLTIHKNQKTGETKCIYDDIVPQGILNSSWLNEKKDIPYFFPPTAFSRTDSVQQRLLKNDVNEDAENSENFAKVVRKGRSKYGKIIQFNLTDPVPTKPNKVFNKL